MKQRIRISDHALVRHAERVEGVDLGPYRRNVARQIEEAIEKADPLTGPSAVVIDGYRYVLKGSVVVTIDVARRPDKSPGCRRG